jgi:hypothetical protein
VPLLHHGVDALTRGLGGAAAWVLSALAEGSIGVAAGTVLLVAWLGVRRLRGSRLRA